MMTIKKLVGILLMPKGFIGRDHSVIIPVWNTLSVPTKVDTV
jgi:hypothetical protein